MIIQCICYATKKWFMTSRKGFLRIFSVVIDEKEERTLDNSSIEFYCI
ncbi:hypothetical protein RchiOBHm_Chr1g0343811 [Rosa chinensis]|uniref:Uncharacterized protein n=1 Tax=Rosa chinensis TaxID=74649 RepID=A0A2P6SEB9_ROSCH|nr:hypothetical protein RchiOBHm_Chr1g0343811 [Rosa chinensis]